MNPEIKRKWQEELRSGNYTQGSAKLRTTDDEYCCLGVLCELAIEAGVVVRKENLVDHCYAYGTQEDIDLTGIAQSVPTVSMIFLPQAVVIWAGLPNANPRITDENQWAFSLATLNDDGVPFEVIADYIEQL